MSVEEQSRYFTYNLAGEFQPLPANNGTLKFFIPPLRANGYSDHYKQALVKIKSVQIGGSAINNDDPIPIVWANIGSVDRNFCLGGINLYTNLGTGNSGFIGDESQTINQDDTNGQVQFRNRYGVLLKPTISSYFDTGGGGGSHKARPLDFHYEDNSDIDKSGTIVGLPFGQYLDITFQEAKQGIDGLPMVPVSNVNGARINNVGVSITIEFKLI